MPDGSTTPMPRPRLVLAFLAGILAVQGAFAGIDILGDDLDGSTPARTVVAAAFVLYAAMIVLFGAGVWRRAGWAWPLAVTIAGSGLALAGLRIISGDPAESLMLGMVIDGALLYYLAKPSIRGLFTT